MFIGGRIHRQWQVCIDLPEEEPGACLPVDEVGVLADPSESCLFGERLFEHRRRVDEDTVTVSSDGLLDTLRELCKPSAHQLVIIASECIAGNVGKRGILDECEQFLVFIREIVHADGNDAAGVLDEQFRPAAHGAVTLHVVHLSVIAVVQPPVEAIFRDSKVGIGNSDLLEAEFFAPGPDFCGKLCKILRR